jgi:hypothetical protein
MNRCRRPYFAVLSDFNKGTPGITIEEGGSVGHGISKHGGGLGSRLELPPARMRRGFLESNPGLIIEFGCFAGTTSFGTRESLQQIIGQG